jgi:hypothetical protein
VDTAEVDAMMEDEDNKRERERAAIAEAVWMVDTGNFQRWYHRHPHPIIGFKQEEP